MYRWIPPDIVAVIRGSHGLRIAVLLGAVTIACAPAATGRGQATALPTHPQPSLVAGAAHRPSPLALGVYTDAAPERAQVAHYAKVAGTAPAIVMWYSEFDTPLFTASQLRDTRKLRTTPLISWRPTLNGHEGIPFADIADGGYDNYLRAEANRAREAGRPIFVRWAYEMNLSGQDYGSAHPGETPETFVAAWRHIVDVFRAAKATNVKWVWSPNTDCAGRCPFTSYFPGNSYVDWLGLDGYNFAAVHDDAWVSLHYIFASSYATITKLSSKPLMIAEVASAPGPGDKAQWIRHGFMKTIPQDFPRVRAAIWFDAIKEADWRVNSSPASLKAWRKVAGSHRYSGHLAP
jgi:hypothetical protein